jgi:hypothetical protein
MLLVLNKCLISWTMPVKGERSTPWAVMSFTTSVQSPSTTHGRGDQFMAKIRPSRHASSSDSRGLRNVCRTWHAEAITRPYHPGGQHHVPPFWWIVVQKESSIFSLTYHSGGFPHGRCALPSASALDAFCLISFSQDITVFPFAASTCGNWFMDSKDSK